MKNLHQILYFILNTLIIFVTSKQLSNVTNAQQKSIIIISPAFNITCDKTRTWRNIKNGIIKSKFYLQYTFKIKLKIYNCLNISRSKLSVSLSEWGKLYLFDQSTVE